jgi:hypothetical protein
MRKSTAPASTGSTATVEQEQSAAPCRAGTDKTTASAVAVVRQPILISGQPAAVATAVVHAVPGQRHWWSAIVTIVSVAGHRVVAVTTVRVGHHSAPRPTFPKRYSYLDDACLSREMYRL